MIDEKILSQFGADTKKYSKGDRIFSQGDEARYYFQMVSGEVKMNNYNDDGKEFLQGIFTHTDSFGEPPLLIDERYPANAEALSDVVLWQLPKQAFFEMQRKVPEAAIAIGKRLAQRLYYKSIMASEISSQDPEHRLLKLIDYLKKNIGTKGGGAFEVNLTRQQLADLTGLRVETVIRAIKNLERKGHLKIDHRKILR
ncbi:MAG: Crp/Fnr family transcriptional regulator [Flavobacterium sp.]|nr:Crp/Fnr family transcriptional regulator [Flavobacterium sp.]